MSAETGSLPFLLFAAILSLGGLHGLFFYSGLGKKILSWCALQLGMALCFLFRSPFTSLSQVLLLETVLVTTIVALVLAAFSFKSNGNRRGAK